ncbi:glyoxalase [Rhodococcus wratislaviensis]|uniref:glyoxalase n=1 Tax=Rhodococcus wratislaviensis TaxID=44752 RepID=UPI00364CD1D6
MSTTDTRPHGAATTTATTFSSTADLTSALIRAAIAHGQHETRTGAEDPNWPDWYAAYIVAEQAGTELPL